VSIVWERAARVFVSFVRHRTDSPRRTRTVQGGAVHGMRTVLSLFRGLPRQRCRMSIASLPIMKVARADMRTPAALLRNPRCEQRSNACWIISPKRGLTGGDHLEIGCGYGYLLDEARLLACRTTPAALFGGVLVPDESLLPSRSAT
jgi:hypothetical protein